MNVRSQGQRFWFTPLLGVSICAALGGCGERVATSGGNDSAAYTANAGDDDAQAASAASTKSSQKKKSSTAKLGAPNADATPKPVDCGNMTMHEGQEHCDTDDLAAHEELLHQPAPVDDSLTQKPKEPEPADKTPEPTPSLPTLDPAAKGDPNVVVFRIKSGTGSGVWNTQAEMITVKLGQVLRIVNDDSITHRLHTNGAPCPHGVNFGPGASADCLVAKAFDPKGNAGPLYDHIAGTKAQFWIKAEP